MRVAINSVVHIRWVVQKTENWFGFDFKDQTVQKFDIHSDRNCVQSAIQIKSDKNNLVAFSVQIKNVLKCYRNIEFIM